MTNINQINETAQALGVTNPKSGQASGNSGFSDALNDAVTKAQNEKTEANQINTLTEIPAGNPAFVQTSDIVTSKTDSLLNMLEEYSTQLGNPEVSLKSIAPALEQLNANADTLLKESEKLSNNDQELKEIATQTAMTAQTEYLKFQRGDYV